MTRLIHPYRYRRLFLTVHSKVEEYITFRSQIKLHAESILVQKKHFLKLNTMTEVELIE